MDSDYNFNMNELHTASVSLAWDLWSWNWLCTLLQRRMLSALSLKESFPSHKPAHSDFQMRSCGHDSTSDVKCLPSKHKGEARAKEGWLCSSVSALARVNHGAWHTVSFHKLHNNAAANSSLNIFSHVHTLSPSSLFHLSFPGYDQRNHLVYANLDSITIVQMTKICSCFLSTQVTFSVITFTTKEQVYSVRDNSWSTYF